MGQNTEVHASPLVAVKVGSERHICQQLFDLQNRAKLCQNPDQYLSSYMPGQFSCKNMKMAVRVIGQGEMSPDVLVTAVVYSKMYSCHVTSISEQ